LDAGALLFAAIGGLARAVGRVIAEHHGAALGLPAPLPLPDLIVAGHGSDVVASSRASVSAKVSIGVDIFWPNNHTMPRCGFDARRVLTGKQMA
jgi:hypothetical protein